MSEVLIKVENLSKSLVNFKNTIKNCEICGCLSDYDKCEICSDEHRDKSTICIVEDSKSVFSIEKTKKYNGYYDEDDYKNLKKGELVIDNPIQFCVLVVDSE